MTADPKKIPDVLQWLLDTFCPRCRGAQRIMGAPCSACGGSGKGPRADMLHPERTGQS